MGNWGQKMAAENTAAEADLVVAIHSAAEWDTKLMEASGQKKLIVVDFTASWCGPCKFMGPHFAELSRKYPDVLFLKVDVDQLPDITSKWDVSAMPTFVFILGGKLVHKIVGADKKGLEAKVQEFSKARAY